MEENHLFTRFAKELLDKHQTHECTVSLKENVIGFLNQLIDFLFPHFSSKNYYTTEDVIAKLKLLERDLIELLKLLNGNKPNNIESVAHNFINKIPFIHTDVWKDAEAIYNGDPAAESIDEVIIAYPGFMAILIYRIAHELYLLKVPIIPRIITENAHQITGIDIHPGATIGSSFFIDHGTGIVIGETTTIGKNVKIYQGVTLGALYVGKELANKKRHPTIEDNVIIYAGSTILGGATAIGHDTVIGGNTWLTESVLPFSVVYHKPSVVIRDSKKFKEPINFVI